MTPVQRAMSTVLMGWSLDLAREAMARPVPGECFWLLHHCGKETAPNDWLCPEHRAWTPNLGGEVK